MVKKYSLTFPTIPQTFCSSTLVSEQFTRHSKYRPFAFSAACHKAYPMLVFIAFQYLSSKAGRGVAFLILAGATSRRWLVLREFAKYAFCGLKKSGLRKSLDRLLPRINVQTLLYFSRSPKVSPPLPSPKGPPLHPPQSVLKTNAFILGKKIQKSYRLDNLTIRISYHSCGSPTNPCTARKKLTYSPIHI